MKPGGNAHHFPAVRELEARLQAAWSRTDRLFALLKPGAVHSQPIFLRHPFIFYLGHLPAFAWNQICKGILQWNSLNPFFDEIFSRGIDPDVDDPQQCHTHPEAPSSWPKVEQVLQYRDRVRDAVLESVPAVRARSAANLLAERGRVFAMVIEHECMHQETLLYMMHELAGDDKVSPANGLAYRLGDCPRKEEIEIAGGKATLGASFESVGFGWDNEFPVQSVAVPGFKVDSLPTSNAEFFDFVESGAYDQSVYWRQEDWAWKVKTGSRQPRFWVREGRRWFYRTLFDLLPLDKVLSWPIYVSFAEAYAYCRWRGRRLLTEAEYQRAAYGTPDREEDFYPWGDDLPEEKHGNFDFHGWSPAPSGSHPAGASAWGVHELMGNGWEWTSTPFTPFDGFQPYIETYPDYSADFFDHKHYVLKGASWATAKELLRPSFRNWYQARYPYVFAKFRTVRDL